MVTIGGIENPDGGLWARLSFIPYVPILNITPHPAMPVDIDALKGNIYTVGFQYDPVVYAPLYWGNPIALLNALAAFETVHGYYLTPNGNGPNDPIAYGYSQAELADQLNCETHPANCRKDKYGNTYVMIPAKSLPLADLVMSLVPSGLKPIVKPFVDLVTPVLKVIADLGYDWSGDPSVVRPLSILPFNPFQNWLAVAAKLVVAAVQGIQAFIGDLGNVGASTVAPDSTQTPSLMRTMSLVGPPSGEEKESLELSKNGAEAEGQESQNLTQGQTEQLQNEGAEPLVDKSGVELQQDPVEVQQDPVEVEAGSGGGEAGSGGGQAGSGGGQAGSGGGQAGSGGGQAGSGGGQAGSGGGQAGSGGGQAGSGGGQERPRGDQEGCVRRERIAQLLAEAVYGCGDRRRHRRTTGSDGRGITHGYRIGKGRGLTRRKNPPRARLAGDSFRFGKTTRPRPASGT